MGPLCDHTFIFNYHIFIFIFYSVDGNGQYSGGLEVYKHKVQIHHDGNNSRLNPVLLKSICSIDVSFFPFDDQQCSLKFGSWAFDASGIDMKTPQPSGAPNSYYIPNREWQLLSIESTRNEKKYQCCEVPFTDLTVKIKLRRHAINYTLTRIIRAPYFDH